MDHKVIIEPTIRDAKELRQWLMSQGDMRGFVCHENGKNYLVIFHSYGHTHTSMIRLLGIGSGQRKVSVDDTLVFRTDGTVLTDTNARGEIKDPVIRAIYHPIIPRWSEE